MIVGICWFFVCFRPFGGVIGQSTQIKSHNQQRTGKAARTHANPSASPLYPPIKLKNEIENRC
jgi:hypothetical protein